jgi:hypothetical protein
MAKHYRAQISKDFALEWRTNPTTILVSTAHDGAKRLSVSHPMMLHPLHIDPAYPDAITNHDAESYAFGTDALGLASGALYRHLHAAMKDRFSLTDEHAEAIVEAWDARSHHMTPGWQVEPIANA